jgi:hypothetical protein
LLKEVLGNQHTRGLGLIQPNWLRFEASTPERPNEVRPNVLNMIVIWRKQAVRNDAGFVPQ